MLETARLTKQFQHTAARRRLVLWPSCCRLMLCFNTQPPEGGWGLPKVYEGAGNSFNTQPPEGGWSFTVWPSSAKSGFNTQPPEGGWLLQRRNHTGR